MSIIHKIKQRIPVSIKTRILYYLSNSESDIFDQYQGKLKVIIALAADYANLGDVAITHVQAQFIKSILPDREIVYFPCAATFMQMKALKRIITTDDIITIVGGGNMGDLYDSLEDARRFIIEQFPKNRIISFPQTIDFSDTPKGQQELHKTKRAYRNHQGLHIFAREPVSFETMKRCFPYNQVALVPDIVLSLNPSGADQLRHGVLLCIRNDAESMLSSGDRIDFVNSLKGSITDVSVTDTMSSVSDRLPITERFVELETLLSAFRRAQVVVTDRLHGMIFAAITGTPCVVLLNNNHKIKATYDTWLAGLPHIRLQENFDPTHVLENVEDLRVYSIDKIAPPNLDAKYETLKKAISGQNV